VQEIAETTAGRVAGVERKGIRIFRGIPFARAPRGGLRLRGPEPPEPWAGVRDATAAGPAAPQPAVASTLVGRLLPAATSRTDEDCLSLNVFTPGVDGARRPVLVWIHGGAFVMGTGSSVLYSGRRLARRGDVVVVTINYRLGALGFLHLTDASEGRGGFDANCGLRDQIAALAFVRDNAAAFGGDPANVTIFGESAGAMSVGALLGCPAARGLFHRAIAQSGAAHNVSGREQAAAVARHFLGELGLAPHSAEQLREVPVEALLAAQTRTSLALGLGHGTLPWQPAVDGDLLREPPLAEIGRGLAKEVPLIVGTNRDEWRLFMLGDRKGRRMDEAALGRRLARALPGDAPDGTSLAERAQEHLRRAARTRRDASPAARWAAFQRDRIFAWPATRLAELASAHRRDTYAYRLDWSPPLLRPFVGACHAIEIPLVFGTWRHPWLRPLFGGSATVRRLSRTLQNAWTEFARHGDPNHGALPDWPGYDARRRATMILDAECRAEDAPDGPSRRFFAELEAWRAERDARPERDPARS
jgi:para-nitrobenzyl esterase